MKNLFNSSYNNRKVLITGHTGFKGSWLAMILKELGADVYGFALDPPTHPSLFNESGLNNSITSYIGDIRDYKHLSDTILKIKPDIIFHLAAQALVRASYKNPIETYSTNVMGVVNILEAVRQTESVKAIINVTTDKCYENKEWYWGYRENEAMGGYDPYSNSKGCSELVTASFRQSYFNPDEFKTHGVAVASARAGNVIGGGDWANDRLIPDFIRSIANKEKLYIRSPYAIRPWQHVLEPLSGYLSLGEKLLSSDGYKYAEGWNFGPEDNDAKNVEWITKKICELWGDGASYEIDHNPQPHEANYLKLDCSKAKSALGWYPKWNIETALEAITTWNKETMKGKNVTETTVAQIHQYFNS